MSEDKFPVLTVPYEKIVEMMAIDVTGLAETRMGLTYLPWAEAELLLRQYFPTYKVVTEVSHWMVGETRYCAIEAKIVDCVTGVATLPEYFPVMDNGKQRLAKPNPTPRDISDSIKRASVKVIARETGIGLSLYRKEKDDLPESQFHPAPSIGYAPEASSTAPASDAPKSRLNFSKKLV